MRNAQSHAAAAPFLQPQHKVPTERYSIDGLQHLLSKHGFQIQEAKPTFSVYHTLHWLVYEWLHMKNTLGFRLLRPVLLLPLVYMAKRSTLVSNVTASAFRVVAVKPGGS